MYIIIVYANVFICIHIYIYTCAYRLDIFMSYIYKKYVVHYYSLMSIHFERNGIGPSPRPGPVPTRPWPNAVPSTDAPPSPRPGSRMGSRPNHNMRNFSS